MSAVDSGARTVRRQDRSAPPPFTDRAFNRGAESLLFDYARLTPGQAVVFVYDPGVEAVCRAIGARGRRAGIAVAEVSTSREWRSVLAHVTRADAVVFLEAGESHHTRSLLRHLARPGCATRAYRLFGATPETIRTGFTRRQATLRRRNWSLIHRARGAGHLRVTSRRGTRLDVGLDRAAPWTSTYGECAGGYPGIWPPAEVNTRSADVDGVLVADGAIASNVGWPLDARLAAHPVTLRVSRGTITDVECRHALVRDLITEFLSVPRTNEVVEIGIGTNDGIPRFLPSDILLNERVASFHLGVGSADAEIQERNLHMDFILGSCRVYLGRHLALRNGRFSRAAAPPVPHPGAYDVPIALHDAL